jgi:hypothetical protein
VFWVIIGAGCAAVLLRVGSEPSYQHRTLRQWLAACPDPFSDYETYGGPGPKTLEAQTAVRAMGSNTVPTLMAMFVAKESRLPHWMPFRPPEASKQHRLAETGFRLLGLQALPAVPALSDLARQPDPQTQLRALISLSLITSNKEVLVPVLTERLKDADWQVRAVAGAMLQDKSKAAGTSSNGFE